MDKEERKIIKALKQKPIDKKAYQELKRRQAETEKWLDNLRKNYPGVCIDSTTIDGMTVYTGEEW